MIKNFVYGGISERSFSNPHPWTMSSLCFNADNQASTDAGPSGGTEPNEEEELNKLTPNFPWLSIIPISPIWIR